MPRAEIIRSWTLYWVPFFLYSGLIVFLSHQSDPTFGHALIYNDKLVHAGEYFILFLLTVRAFRQSSWPHLVRYSIVFSLLYAVVFACADEWHQSFIALRSMSFCDIVADVGGITAGALIARIADKSEIRNPKYETISKFK